MAFKIRNANSTWRDPVASRIRNSNGTWRFATTVRKRLPNGTWVTVWQALAVTASNISNSAFAYEPAPTQRAMTGYASPAVTGSTAYTAAWVRLSGDAGIACSNSATLNPAFSASVAKNTSKTAVWQIAVSDTDTGLTATQGVSI